MILLLSDKEFFNGKYDKTATDADNIENDEMEQFLDNIYSKK